MTPRRRAGTCLLRPQSVTGEMHVIMDDAMHRTTTAFSCCCLLQLCLLEEVKFIITPRTRILLCFAESMQIEDRVDSR